MRNNQRGMALILVLWIMIALILVAAGISLMARTETQISRNYSDMMRCKWAAKAGIYCAFETLKSTGQESTTYLGEEPSTGKSEDHEIDMDGYKFTYTIEDECGKVNINSADRDMLIKIFDNEEIADCIIDWRDADDVPGIQGVESDYYSKLTPAYMCKNADFETLRELELVKGITADSLLSTMPDGEIALQNMLTSFSSQASAENADDNKVDIGTANQQTLQSEFGSVLSSEDISAIISYRTNQPFRNVSDIVLVPNLDRSKIIQIYDRLSVADPQITKGQININAATVDVLSVLPGMDRSIAQSIVDYRKEQGAFNSAGKLLEINEVTNEAFSSAAPYFMIKSTVFKIISEGSFEKTGVSAKITCIVEMQNNGQPQIRYWQE